VRILTLLSTKEDVVLQEDYDAQIHAAVAAYTILIDNSRA
jgi:hypothetical protein